MKPLARLLALVVVAVALAAPTPAHAVEPGFETADVAASTYFAELEHNVADVVGTFADGAAYEASFLQHFEQTGGVERWGFPTSAIVCRPETWFTPVRRHGLHIPWLGGGPRCAICGATRE